MFGIGGLGHLALQYATMAGGRVVAVDLLDEKLELAKELGAEFTVNAAKQDPAAAIQELGGADQAIALAVSPKAFEHAYGSLRRGGTLVFVGLPADNAIELPIFETVLNGITVVGSIVGTRLDLREVFELHAAGRTRVIREVPPLAEINEASRRSRPGTSGPDRLPALSTRRGGRSSTARHGRRASGCDVGEHAVEWPRDAREVERLDEQPCVADLAIRHEAAQLLLEGARAVGLLLLVRAERAQLAVRLEDRLDQGRAERADELVLEVELAHVETERLHARASQVGAEPRSLEAAPELALLAGVAEAGQREVEPVGPEVP